MRILSAENVFDLITQNDAINIVEKTMVSVSKRKPLLPLRTVMELGQERKLGVMPGALGSEDTYGIKVLSLFPENPSKGLSSHIGLMLLFDPKTGMPTAAINADALTAVRTAAATAVATKHLAIKDATSMTIIGSGEQAEFHIKSIPLVRPIKNINVVGTTKYKAENLIGKMALIYPSILFEAHDRADKIVGNSEIICTVTSSKDPVIFGDWIQNGTHINAVGASIPIFQEIDETVLLKSKVFVDYKPSVFAQAKEIIEAIKAKTINETHIKAEIGETIEGKKAGRESQEEITLYRSMGLAAQDLACAEFILEKAIEQNVGVHAPTL